MRAWLQLIRLPAVFTAPVDILLGFLLNHDALTDDPPKFALLVVASLCLYMAGMILNDYFDRDLDATERPERPIPSGRISPKSAAIAGAVLLAAGIAVAAVVGLQSLAIAVGLAAAILFYDGFLKRTPLGPLGMGLCRFLNVMLGASAHEMAAAVWERSQWMPAAALGIYIVGVTWFARNEAGKSSRWSMAGGTAVVLLGIGAVAWHVTQFRDGNANPQSVQLALGLMALVVLRRLAVTCFTPEPERVQSAVRLLLMSYVLIAATLIFWRTGQPAYAIGAAALLVPAMFAGRWISAT